MEQLIGRKDEIQILKNTLDQSEASLVAVYGRRRVGKTYLIREYYKNQIVFELTGMYDGSKEEQLRQFTNSLQKSLGSTLSFKPPANWTDAFHALIQFMEVKNKKKKRVLFFDEFPWLDSRKSGFLSAFEHFWNTWGSRQKNLAVIICGSAASWMIRNIVNSKGGLYNRITQKVRLLPFTLAETEAYLKSRGSNLDQYQILQVYMAFGGIPEYLKNVQKGESAAQAIERACFTKDGLLAGEFSSLYHSLFEKADVHIRVVKALASAAKGMTRQEIIDSCNLSSGGRATQMLEELEESGFIRAAPPFDKKAKDLIYRLSDEYTLFYLKFIDKKKFSGKDVWMKISGSSSYKIWSGMTFESVCYKHISQIKKALGIEGVQTVESAWRYIPGKGKPGAQIDLLIDRADRSINVCEIKYYNTEFTIDKSYAAEIQRKLDVFGEKTKTRKALFLTMITVYGVKKNVYSDNLVQKSLTVDALFA